MLRKYTAYFVVNVLVDDENVEEAGFYPADSFSEAMDYLEEFYGDDLCMVHHLEILDSSLMIMDANVAANIVAKNFS